MNTMFKEIRHGELEKILARIAKNSAVVNEIYTGTRPKKDIGQSPLQVAVKCGQFEIINLLLDNGADPDFMENRALF
ncbi:MAG: ankyrin repeat domain-containing protein [Lachnospiraceae bacterium]|nr:ankyrin repeat domain-containing protein [Lachnospiraceae bacterium]